jgi:hypothetical protein
MLAQDLGLAETPAVRPVGRQNELQDSEKRCQRRNKSFANTHIKDQRVNDGARSKTCVKAGRPAGGSTKMEWIQVAGHHVMDILALSLISNCGASNLY